MLFESRKAETKDLVGQSRVLLTGTQGVRRDKSLVRDAFHQLL